MLNRNKKTIVFALILLISFSSASYFIPKTESIDPFFTLVFITNSGGTRPDYGYLLKEQLARIGIHLDVRIFSWADFFYMNPFQDFDITYVGLRGGAKDPDFTGVYNENGSLNLFGYHTSMDWDEELGTGKNEWYMKQGLQMMPPNSLERIQHYWDWEDYLMDKILPIQPTFLPKTYMAYWSNLNGYNYSEGILQSWGKMTWDGSHTGQISTNELVIADRLWADLNPLFLDDTASDFIVDACYDPLFWYDNDLTVWPHLAENFTMINDTCVRITARKGIKWQSDPDNLFTSEYFDIFDVFFTLYCWKEVSDDQHHYNWINNMVIIDQWTMDINIDGYPGTLEKEPYVEFLPRISTKILPEHYLNQTQLPDGKTPDTMHSSWNTLATECIGTGLFENSNYAIGDETTLSVNPECWWLNQSLTSDPNLEWESRFGDFSGDLDQLRIRIIPETLKSLQEFEAGKIDLASISSVPYKRDNYCLCPEFAIQSTLSWSFSFFGYNMREVRPVIGNRSPAPGDSTLTVGLCIRKAISYAMNREEMNDVIHGGEYELSNSPICLKQGIWNNPDIIAYNHNIQEAKKYLQIAGYDLSWPQNGFEISLISVFCGIIVLFTTVHIYFKFRKKRGTRRF